MTHARAFRLVADHLLTMESDASVVSPGVVDVEDGRVAWAGPERDAPATDYPTTRLSGGLIPGLVNTHAHTPMVLMRGAGEGLPVDRWLTEVIWRREGRLDADDVHWAMTLGAAELLQGGVTTSHEMYFYPEAVATAAEAAGMRCVVTPPVLAGDDLARFGAWESQLEAMAEQARHWSGHRLITIGLGPHSAYAVPEEPLRAVADLAAEEGLGVHIHVAEGAGEGAGIEAAHGISVPRYLDRIGLLDVPLVAAHAVWLDEDDIDLFAERGVGVAHCPLSNGKHASGIAPVTAMRERGVHVAVATDGPSSHDRLDMFEEMRGAIRLARLREMDAAALGPGEVLSMVTREGGRVLGRDDLGTLTAGARADMVLVDTSPLVPMVEEADLVTHLVYSAGPELVHSVWVEGRQVVEDGVVTTVDVSEARRQVADRARRLAGDVT